MSRTEVDRGAAARGEGVVRLTETGTKRVEAEREERFKKKKKG